MQVDKLKNMIFIKNPESNIIDEAFIILKDSVKIKDFSDDNASKFKLNKIDIQKEAEDIINKEIREKNIEYEKFKITKLEKKNKNLKLIYFFTVILLIIFMKIF